MALLEDIKVDTHVKGITPNSIVTIKHVKSYGDQALEVTYVDAEGRNGAQLLFRNQEQQLEIVERHRPLSFTANGELFRLAAEAQRLRYASLFDPLIAVNTSTVDPLPHQITAVYETMLNRQPLRFLLADDPGAGKTIMTGLLIKELIIRGDVAKCLIVAPGSLVEQWQDELDSKFNLHFDILTNEGLQAARTGNWFQEHNLCICRLDKLSRNEDIQEKLTTVDWDLVVVDEAHKMSASYFGSEIKYTKRFRLGQNLSSHTRQLLLLTATPHNGKDEDFQLFLSLIDGDRFEGKFRDGVHTIDCTDIMRRMVKEQLVTMDGRPLFPERYANTVPYPLSSEEAALYKHVTDYVRQEFNRAEQLQNDGRKGTVGFALTILQRRLASSPEAIYQSLRRRRERLESRLREERLLRRGAALASGPLSEASSLTDDEIEDLEDAPEQEVEETEEKIVDQSTAAATIAELETEIKMLRDLEAEAARLQRSGKDTKWQKLSETLRDNPHMFDANQKRRKLVIFTEQRDTLNYLNERLADLIGNPAQVVAIHGQTPRERRRQIQESFMQDPAILILVATDAAGEGINLQRAHLMVNYDLPWNPNRLEQRFGRIHRIGQPDVCHLWNLVAEETREGEVFLRLFRKLEQQRKALGGAVFDILGRVFQGKALRELLIEAIRYGERPEVKAKLKQVIDSELDIGHLRDLIDERVLVHETLDSRRVQEIREMMERAQARRLQPHYIGSFFATAFPHFGGQLLKREPRRFEIRNVPAEIRQRDRLLGNSAPILKAYERITFHKEDVRVDAKPPAALVAPGHPLLDATVDLVLEKYRDLLREGTILIDETERGCPHPQQATYGSPRTNSPDPATSTSGSHASDENQPRLLFCLEHSITDGRQDNNRNPLTISRQLQFVEIYQSGRVVTAGPAPYLDYTPATPDQLRALEPFFAQSPSPLWGEERRAERPDQIEGDGSSAAIRNPESAIPKVSSPSPLREEGRGEVLQSEIRNPKSEIPCGEVSHSAFANPHFALETALAYAIEHIVPQHLRDVSVRRENHIRKTMEQVHDRLTREIQHWDHRANELKAQEDAGKSRSSLNSSNARQRANALSERLQKRIKDLELEKKIVARPPNVLGGALIVPLGFFERSTLHAVEALHEAAPPYGTPSKEVELAAVRKVMETERRLGFEPRDVSAENRGYDIESRNPKSGTLRFIEVKGRVEGAPFITVTKNEILTGLNRPEAYFLAVVIFGETGPEEPRYIRGPFTQEPEFATASVSLKLEELLESK